MDENDNEQGALDLLAGMSVADARALIKLLRSEGERSGLDALRAEYQARLAKIPRGNVVAVTQLQTEYMQKGLNMGEVEPVKPIKPKPEQQDSLDEEYRERLSRIRRGDVAAISQLQTEMMLRGWTDQPVQEPDEALSQDDQAALKESYWSELKKIPRGDWVKISQLQIKYRKMGLII